MRVAVSHAVLLMLAILAAPGCAPVGAWQRGALLDRRMQVAPHPEREAARQHVLSVREGAAGGNGVAGGGCGCD